MIISEEKFEEMVSQALDELPERFSSKIHNVAIFVEDYATPEQLGNLGRSEKNSLFGLFEGYVQSRRINIGPVLPDRITLFRIPICRVCQTEEECRKMITQTLRHEIAHHFGSDEHGAEKAGSAKS